MLTLSKLNQIAEGKKAAKEALAKVTGAVTSTGSKIVDVAEAAAQAVAGAVPASNKALNERTVDILTVVAGLEQRVEVIEEEMQLTVEVDYDKAHVRANSVFDQMKARRQAREEAKKQEKKQDKQAPVVETPAAQPKVQLSASAPVQPQVPAVQNRPRVGIRFDAVPTMNQ